MPAPQTPFLPGGLPLPYYARLDLAYIDTQYFASAPAGLVYQVVTPAGFLMVMLYAYLTLTTSAVVGARTIIPTYRDVTNVSLWAVPTADFIPENATVTVTMLNGLGGNYATGSSYIVEVPDTVVLPGGKVFFNASGWQSGDQMTSLNFSRILIPTGPAADQPLPDVAPLAL